MVWIIVGVGRGWIAVHFSENEATKLSGNFICELYGKLTILSYLEPLQSHKKCPLMEAAAIDSSVSSLSSSSDLLDVHVAKYSNIIFSSCG